VARLGALVDFARRWWFSATGKAEISLRQAGEALSKNGLICAVNSYYLACGFFTAILGSESVESVRCGGEWRVKTEGKNEEGADVFSACAICGSERGSH
jgi:hypothetical protein